DLLDVEEDDRPGLDAQGVVFVGAIGPLDRILDPVGALTVGARPLGATNDRAKSFDRAANVRDGGQRSRGSHRELPAALDEDTILVTITRVIVVVGRRVLPPGEDVILAEDEPEVVARIVRLVD